MRSLQNNRERFTLQVQYGARVGWFGKERNSTVPREAYHSFFVLPMKRLALNWLLARTRTVRSQPKVPLAQPTIFKTNDCRSILHPGHLGAAT
jgi:hypothetical protein